MHLLLALLSTASFAGPSPLAGLLRQDCARGFLKEERIQGAHAALTETNFRDPACTQPSVSIESRGTLFPGGNVLLPIGASELDFLFVGVRLTPRDEAAAAYYEREKMCGLEGWKVNEAKEIGGLFCELWGRGRPVPVPRAGLRKYGVVKATPEALYFGRLSPERDASAPEKRPLELDPVPYKRVSEQD